MTSKNRRKFNFLVIINPHYGKENQVEVVPQPSNNTALIFESKPDQNNQMTTYLLINKNNETIIFRLG